LSLSLPIPHLTYEEIRRKADEFLTTWYPNRVVPVPIEEIVDLGMGINIVPIHGLEQEFDIDGFTSSDLREISVDLRTYEKNQNRFRFTLAHEVGHIFIHGKILRQVMIRTLEQWRSFYRSLSDFESKLLEFQANCFAGLILVPGEHLEREAGRCLQQICFKSGLPLKENSQTIWETAKNLLAQIFQVSSQVIARRMEYDKIKEKCEKGL